jgi:hypothetical protein
VPGPPGGGGGGGGYGYGAPQEDFAMGRDIMYATRAMRHSFLRKVLTIVAAQLCLTAAVAAPILLLPGPSAFLAANRWAVPISGIVAFASLLVLVCSEGARRAYPSNLLLLGVFTAAQGVLVGVACASYSTPTVLWAVVLTAAVCVFLVRPPLALPRVFGPIALLALFRSPGTRPLSHAAHCLKPTGRTRARKPPAQPRATQRSTLKRRPPNPRPPPPNRPRLQNPAPRWGTPSKQSTTSRRRAACCTAP